MGRVWVMIWWGESGGQRKRRYVCRVCYSIIGLKVRTRARHGSMDEDETQPCMCGLTYVNTVGLSHTHLSLLHN